jgi:hypothetical protein
MSFPNQVATNTRVLASILNEIGASECLQVFIDDSLNDDALTFLSKLKPERVSSIYGLSLDQAAAFSDATHARARRADTTSHDDVAERLATPRIADQR